MTWYQILTVIGIPSIVTAVLNWFERRAVRKEKAKDKSAQKTDALALGVQALLRAQMIDDYNHYAEKGAAPIYARENFENLWKQYENLGANGVMDHMRAQFLSLPLRSPEETQHNENAPHS